MFKKRTQKKSTKTKSKSKPWTMTRQQSLLLGGFLVFFGLALIISFSSYMVSWQGDQSLIGSFERNNPADNYLSHLGNALGHLFIYNGFGMPM